MMVEVQWYGNSDELLLSPSTAFCLPMIHVEHQPSVGNFVSIAFVFRSWSLCLDGRSDFLEFMCIWCKLPPWVRERLFLFPLVPSQVSHACAKYSVVWQISYHHSICIPSTPSHWSICLRKRSSFLRARLMQGLRYPRWWFPTRTR